MTTTNTQHEEDVAKDLPSRVESDSMGELPIPAGTLWGAQTQRSLENFPIGGIESRMPLAVVHGMAIVKKSCALYHSDLGVMEDHIARAIAQAADEVLAGKLDRHFPLVTFQTGRCVCNSCLGV
jgi:fumarate hydratase class II